MRLPTKRLGQAAWMLALGVLAFAFLGVSPDNQAAAKGGGSTPPPAGTIYFSKQGLQVWNMRGDGTGKGASLPEGLSGVPSSRYYRGMRWWLTSAPVGIDNTNPDNPRTVYELFAFRHDPVANAEEWVQLTDVYQDGIGIPDYCQPRWSNDGQDSFVSFVAGGPNGTGRATQVYRAIVNPTIIEQIAAGGNRCRATDLESVMVVVGAYLAYDWSRDGRAVVYSNYYGGHSLKVRTVATGEDVLLLTPNAIAGTRVSPAADVIACEMSLTVDGTTRTGIWTLNADGTGLKLLAQNGAATMCKNPVWSPDGQYIAYNYSKYSLGAQATDYHIYRMTAAGTGGTNLTGDRVLDARAQKELIGWESTENVP